MNGRLTQKHSRLRLAVKRNNAPFSSASSITAYPQGPTDSILPGKCRTICFSRTPPPHGGRRRHASRRQSAPRSDPRRRTDQRGTGFAFHEQRAIRASRIDDVHFGLFGQALVDTQGAFKCRHSQVLAADRTVDRTDFETALLQRNLPLLEEMLVSSASAAEKNAPPVRTSSTPSPTPAASMSTTPCSPRWASAGDSAHPIARCNRQTRFVRDAQRQSPIKPRPLVAPRVRGGGVHGAGATNGRGLMKDA